MSLIPAPLLFIRDNPFLSLPILILMSITRTPSSMGILGSINAAECVSYRKIKATKLHPSNSEETPTITTYKDLREIETPTNLKLFQLLHSVIQCCDNISS